MRVNVKMSFATVEWHKVQFLELKTLLAQR